MIEHGAYKTAPDEIRARLKIVSFCVQCGPNVSVDEDGCCLACGADAVGESIQEIESMRKQLEAALGELARLKIKAQETPVDEVEEHFQALEEENDKLKAELERRKGDPVTRLHNICEGIQEDAKESPFSREEWQRVDAEQVRLTKELKEITAEHDKLKAENANRCPTCDAKINVGGCLACGAPQCCPMCCQITTLKAENSSLRNRLGDNLCHLSDPDSDPVPP